MYQCVTCKTTQRLLKLVIEGNDDTDGQDESFFFCDTCWTAIAGIAQRANNWKFNEMQKKLDALEQKFDQFLLR